ncbi:MAG: efflux RND transporter periplasmic adaptor subunit [Oceanipulchritudo sp.]
MKAIPFPLSSATPLLPFLAAALSGLLLGGCGKPPANENQGGDFPVTAVIAPVEERVLEEKIFLVGSLEAIEEVELISEVDAPVTDILFEEGEPVEPDDTLIRLDDRKLKASVAEMKARYDLAQANVERSKTLLERNTISQQEFDQALAEFDSAKAILDLARERLQDATIHAPFKGVMTERLISRGQYMTRGQPLASLVTTDPIEVEFNIPERYIGQLRLDQRIEITVEAWPEKRFAGKVSFISPRVDRNSRTILLKARIPNPDGHLKPGMFGSLELIFRVREAALVIPEASISYTGDQASVVVMNDEGKAEFRQIVVGTRLSGDAEVTEGLDEGERVVVEGFQKMRPDSTILISEESRDYGIEPDSESESEPAEGQSDS